MLNVKLSSTVKTIPHISNQVLIAGNSLVRTVLTDKVRRYELGRILKQLIDSLDNISIKLHLDFEAFKVDIRWKVDEAILQFVDNIVHEHNYLVVMVFNAAQVSIVIFKLRHVLVKFSTDIIDSTFLQYYCFIHYLFLSIPIVFKELHQWVYVLSKFRS